jgi:uncharacterized OB-fold protein
MSTDEWLSKSKPWTESALIAEALKDGREPRDIAIVRCDRCGSITYYNEGSHCSCEHCGANLDHLTDPDTGEVTTLDDHLEALLSDDLP